MKGWLCKLVGHRIPGRIVWGFDPAGERGQRPLTLVRTRRCWCGWLIHIEGVWTG